MTGKVQKKRDDLRVRLIDLAEERIKTGGISAVRARDLAKEAGCAVGAIYNVFGDMNDLIMAVNARTFKRVGAQVSAAVEAEPPGHPVKTMIAMSHAYLHFARDNTPAWRTLFDLEVSTEEAVPAWYLEELQKVFSLIADPLTRIFPDMPAADVALMTRGLFSAVHGIVLLGLEKRISAVPVDQLEHMITLVFSHLTSTPSEK
ncbi:TetR/AcrR family transcriptional regulator [Litoreibacter arenae]|uniref:Transcriptional regulator, TetR family n=1 Tax=Litoreibacter arenae DSM 19593 TaxID=1123360 RepID=S9QQ15_9RHOB|nr:TetR/AcrR family transcriptional regulator [Litoreibacter arenae]EPX81703.1 Transcriptional regulator, TetR family [Litoreibacter arenae DSM 19593]